jgi:subtilase family serine protease
VTCPKEKEKMMRPWKLPLGTAVALVLAFAGVGYAGDQKPGAIPGAVAEIDPSATARFTCELRPFDLSQGLYCYGPAAIRTAYGVDGLLNRGFKGAGRTIVILDAFGSPTVESDLNLFDSVYGIPAPPSFNVVTFSGTPPFDPNNADMVGWTGEIALDTQWAHAMAPDANIILVAAKSDSDQDLTDALNYILDHHLGDVVSMSFGESEALLANPGGLDIVKAWSDAFEKARQQHVTLFVSSGDQGVDTQSLGFPSVSWPASSPLVTGVGGTNLRFGTAANAAPSPTGTYRSEMVWNDTFGAGGGGMSILVSEPDYQLENLRPAVNRTLHRHRGVPDVAYNAGVVGGVIVAWGVPFGPGAFFIFGGTSAGAPQWSGIIADLDQARGRPLGFLNQRLYRLGAAGALKTLFHEITAGDNSFNSVPGYPATPGFDLSTGWGTPNFGMLGAILADPDEDSDREFEP